MAPAAAIASSSGESPQIPDIAKAFPDQYEAQLQRKVAHVQTLFSGWTMPELQVFRSPAEHYRMRAEFGVWHDKGEQYYIMHEQPAAQQPSSDAPGEVAEQNAAATTEPEAAESAETPGQPAKKATGQKRPRPEAQKVRRRVDQFPRASRLLNQLMAAVMAHVNGNPVLAIKLFQVNFHTTLSGDAMVTMLYHKKLDDAWTQAAKKLRVALAADCSAFAAPAPSSKPHADGHSASAPEAQSAGADGPQVANGAPAGQADTGDAGEEPEDSAALPGLLGRSRKQRIVLGRDFVTEQLHVGDRDLTYRRALLYCWQLEGAFSQPNGAVCQHMLHWAVQATQGCTGDLLELYCGNGNFTVALAPNFGKVVATEVAKPSVAAALHNAAANGEQSLHIARLSSEEFVQAWRGKRAFSRLQGLDLKALKLNTLFVDPPRAGLDAETEKLLAEFDNLIYVSCNPATLHANLATVQQTHAVQSFALFDQFPYTEHVECGVYLTRRPAS